jgi:hypothetical protein
MINIVYLNPDSANDLPDSFRSLEWAKAIASHPDAIILSPAEFVASFNTESISDLGYAVVVDAPSRTVINW